MPNAHPIAVKRKELGLTQDAFGGLVGVDGMTVYRWENRITLPRRKVWPKLEEIIGRPISDVLAASFEAAE